MISIKKRSAWRQTAARIRDGSQPRSLLVALEPNGLVLRLKKTRTELRIPYERLYTRACQDVADLARPLRPKPIRRGLLRPS